MSEELAYSIHLGSDKNKTAKAKQTAKNNPSGETSFANNGIQNATQLSKVNKHNLRDYDNNKENIYILYGTENLYQDVQNLYLQEFEQARLEYNNKQTREDRKIDNYFQHISQDKQKDLACELIIELGDMDFWNDKSLDYRMNMRYVFNEQVLDLMKIVPDFKVANAVIHFDELSPHLHLVGVPIKDGYKKGMTKQPAKSKVFTKESLQRIQDEMRNCCIKSYNKHYEKISLLKPKKKGRNQDIDVKDMGDYRQIKKQLEQKEKKLSEANKQTQKLDNTTNDINSILENLKQELHKFKDFWYNIMNHFHKRICYEKNENYKIVSDDLYKNGIFTDDENEIANNIYKKVKPKEDIEKSKNKKKDNFELK